MGSLTRKQGQLGKLGNCYVCGELGLITGERLDGVLFCGRCLAGEIDFWNSVDEFNSVLQFREPDPLSQETISLLKSTGWLKE